MAPNSEPSGGALDQFKKRRKDVLEARAKEDAQRIAKRVTEGKEQQRKSMDLEMERNAQLTQRQMNAQDYLERLQAEHKKEREELQQRQERDIAASVLENDKKRADIETKHNHLREEMLKEESDRLEASKRADEELKHKRNTEDDEWKNQFLEAIDAEILEESAAKQKDITSGNKRTSSDSQPSSSPTEKFAAESAAKRQKLVPGTSLTQPEGSHQDTKRTENASAKKEVESTCPSPGMNNLFDQFGTEAALFIRTNECQANGKKVMYDRKIAWEIYELVRHWNSGDILKNVFQMLIKAKDGLLKRNQGLNGEKLDGKTLKDNIRKVDEAKVTQMTQLQSLYLGMLLAKQQDEKYASFVEMNGTIDRKEWGRKTYEKWREDDKDKKETNWALFVKYGRRYQVWSKFICGEKDTYGSILLLSGFKSETGQATLSLLRDKMASQKIPYVAAYLPNYRPEARRVCLFLNGYAESFLNHGSFTRKEMEAIKVAWKDENLGLIRFGEDDRVTKIDT